MRQKFLFLALSLVLFGQFASGQAYLDRHSAVQTDAWLSNTKSLSPNNLRGVVHWIRYDLGDTYALHKSKFWNVNVPGLLNAGSRTIYIDYSIDGTTWYEWGRLILDQATGNSYYEGQEGPDFSGLAARYLLFNVINTHGHPTLAGLSEWRIESTPTTVSVEETALIQNVEIKASPNPFQYKTNIQFENLPSQGQTYYQLTDVTGKLLLKEEVTAPSVELSGLNLNTGLYYFSLIHKSGIKTISLEIIK